MNENENKIIYQFLVKCMLDPGLNINKAFREQVESNIDFTFRSKTMIPIRKVLRKDNTFVLFINS